MKERQLKERQPGQGSDNEMFSLSWEIETLNNLIGEIRGLHPNISTIIEHLSLPVFNPQQSNIPRQLGKIRDSLVKIIKSVFRFKRSAATHMFVVMISSELRNCKPYALPLCLSCCGLKESDIRRIIIEVITAMVDRGMKVCAKYSISSVWCYIIFVYRLCQ